MRTLLRPAIVMLLFFTLLFGVVYPAIVTGIAQVLFPHESQGSLIGSTGSELIGQPFTSPKYFWGRPSATTPPYNAAASTGSNLAAANPDLREHVNARIALIRKTTPAPSMPVPADLVLASGSGLDPHISPEAAAYQVARVAKARGKKPEEISPLVSRFTEDRQFGIFGEPRVNVLKLNLALDGKWND